ncbi:MAG: hypothetical protein WA814_06845 [Candidatus Baltobacteraceae bacterium]
MRSLLPVLAAGGTFAGAAVLGLLVGALAAQRFDAPLAAPAGLVIGAALGTYGALRLLARAMR